MTNARLVLQHYLINEQKWGETTKTLTAIPIFKKTTAPLRRNKRSVLRNANIFSFAC
jgi:hypothetical protein